MALKDFNASKIKSWTYHDTSAKEPQTFDDIHSGTIVTGQRDKIEEQYMEGLKTTQDVSAYDIQSDPPSAQTFQAGTYTVTGIRDLIEAKFLEGNPLTSKNNATTLDDVIGFKPDTGQTYNVGPYTVTGDKTKIETLLDSFEADPLQYVDSLAGYSQVVDQIDSANPQIFTISNSAGEYSITGLHGSIVFDDLDDLKTKSLVIKTLGDKIESATMRSWAAPDVNSAQKGWRQVPIGLRDFGTGELDSTPIKLGGDATFPGFTVYPKTPQWAQSVTENYTDIITTNSFYGRFTGKLSSLALDNPSGGDSVLGNPFTSVDTLFGLSAGFYLGIRGITLGNILGKPQYTKHTTIYGYDESGVTGEAALVEPDEWDGQSDFDRDEMPKMMYLYDKFILGPDTVDDPHVEAYQFKAGHLGFSKDALQGASNFAAAGASFVMNWILSSFDEKYPIIPTRNQVNMKGAGKDYLSQTSTKYFDSSNDKASSDTSKSVPSLATIVLNRDDSPFISQTFLDASGTDPSKLEDADLKNKPLLVTLYKKLILDGSQILGDEYKTLFDKSAHKSMFPNSSVLPQHPQGGTAQGKAYTDSQKYVSQAEKPRTYQGDKATIAGGDNPFLFYSKHSTTNLRYDVDGDTELSSRYDTSEFAKHEVLKGFIATGSLDHTKPMKSKLVDKIENDITSPLGFTDDDSAGKIPIVGRKKLTEKGHALPYDKLGKEKNRKYGEILMSPSEFAAVEELPTEVAGLVKLNENKQLDMTSTEPKFARNEGAKKVYNIGKNGFVKIDPASTQTTSVYDDALGLVKLSGDGDNKYKTDHIDKVNMVAYRNSEDDHSVGTYEDLDFVPLVFQDVYNEKDIVFRAILGAIEDKHTPDWEEQSFIGRPVKSHVYKGVDREISFDFKVYPKTKQEFPVLLEKVNYLSGLAYPNLDQYYRMSGPLCKLTLGDICKRQLGFLSDISVTFPEDSPWEIQKGLRFTKLINVAVTFKYIGGYIPVSTGKHYELNWLDGEHYSKTGVAFGSDEVDRSNDSNMQKIFASATKVT